LFSVITIEYPLIQWIDVKVVLVKPGPTDTQMTAHLKQQGSRLASVEDVAGLIVKGINQGK